MASVIVVGLFRPTSTSKRLCTIQLLPKLNMGVNNNNPQQDLKDHVNKITYRFWLPLIIRFPIIIPIAIAGAGSVNECNITWLQRCHLKDLTFHSTLLFKMSSLANTFIAWINIRNNWDYHQHPMHLMMLSHQQHQMYLILFIWSHRS